MHLLISGSLVQKGPQKELYTPQQSVITGHGEVTAGTGDVTADMYGTPTFGCVTVPSLVFFLIGQHPLIPIWRLAFSFHFFTWFSQ